MMKEMSRANLDGLKDTTACQEATKTEPNPGTMQFIEESQKISKEEAAGMPIERLRKWRRQKLKERPRDIVDPGGSWLLPAGRCPAVQKWLGEIGTSSGFFRPKEIVDGGRNCPPAVI
jgi:hypothetical protein